MVRLNEAFVKSLEVSKRTIIADDVVKNFAIRVDPNGRKVYIFRYRHKGQQSTYTIGTVDQFTAAQARDEARKISGQIARGINPNSQKKEDRTAPLFRQLAEDYLKSTQKRSLQDDKSKLDRVLLPRWGSRHVNSIHGPDVRKLLKSLADKGLTPATINRYRSLIITLFNRAIEAGWIDKGQNPGDGIKPLQENNERTRWLNDDELTRFFTALEPELTWSSKNGHPS